MKGRYGMTTSNLQMPDGILLIDKPSGMTSHDVVFRVRRLMGTKKVGHTGTLDPMATGVLVVLVGRAAKAAEYVSHDEKTYEATLRIGMTTDTEDTTGQVLTYAGKLPPRDELDAKLGDVLPRFKGEILQVPPMYSALKVNGQKLCDLARRGETVERTPRAVTVREITAMPLSSEDNADDTVADYKLTATVSGGTYIRTLCADIGAAVGYGGVMASLRRTMASGFSIDGCHTLDELEAMSTEERYACLLPVESLFKYLPSLSLPTFFLTLCRNGCEIYQHKLGTAYQTDTRLRLADDKGQFFALGEVREYPEGSAIKAIKLFRLDN